MIRGLYSAATALDAAEQQQEVTAHNLAHSTTPGYRQRGLSFETFDRVLGRTARPTGDLTGTSLVGVYHDFRPGPLQFTGAPFDLALGGDGFFTLNTPNGPVYTRNGTFRLNAQGQIVSHGGFALQGEGGPVTVPPDSQRINIGPDGTVSADGNIVNRVLVTRFANPRQLTAVGDSLYRAGQDAGPQQQAGGDVLQGYRESSNVNPAEAMVQMIGGARYFDAAQRALRAIAESIQLNTRPQT